MNGHAGQARKQAAWLEPLLKHMEFDACLGSISEIFDGDPPYRPRGCVARAWSVAEVLRALLMTLPGPTHKKGNGYFTRRVIAGVAGVDPLTNRPARSTQAAVADTQCIGLKTLSNFQSTAAPEGQTWIERQWEVARIAGRSSRTRGFWIKLQEAGNTTPLAHYLGLLKGCGLLEGLQKYAGQHVRRRSSKPRIPGAQQCPADSTAGSEARGCSARPPSTGVASSSPPWGRSGQLNAARRLACIIRLCQPRGRLCSDQRQQDRRYR